MSEVPGGAMRCLEEPCVRCCLYLYIVPELENLIEDYFDAL